MPCWVPPQLIKTVENQFQHMTLKQVTGSVDEVLVCTHGPQNKALWGHALMHWYFSKSGKLKYQQLCETQVLLLQAARCWTVQQIERQCSFSKNVFSLHSLLHLGHTSHFSYCSEYPVNLRFSKDSKTVVLSDFGTYRWAAWGRCQKVLQLSQGAGFTFNANQCDLKKQCPYLGPHSHQYHYITQKRKTRDYLQSAAISSITGPKRCLRMISSLDKRVSRKPDIWWPWMSCCPPALSISSKRAWPTLQMLLVGITSTPACDRCRCHCQEVGTTRYWVSPSVREIRRVVWLKYQWKCMCEKAPRQTVDQGSKAWPVLITPNTVSSKTTQHWRLCHWPGLPTVQMLR